MPVACTTPPGRPAASSVETVVARLPAERYLSAAGTGDTREAAERSAAGNLAKIFQSRITVEDRMIERTHELLGDRRNAYTSETDFTKNVTIESGLTLYNVRYTEPVADRAGRLTVTAYLDRRETAQIYLARLRAGDARVRAFSEQATASADPVRRFAYWNAAFAVSVVNRAMLEQLTIIQGGAAPSFSPCLAPDEVVRRTAEAAAAVRCSVAVEGEPQIAGLLQETLTGLGLTIGVPPVLRVTARVTIEPTDLDRSDAVFVRYDALLRVADAGGAEVVAVTAKGREGHVSLPEARARAIRALKEKVRAEFRDRLTAHFDALALGGARTWSGMERP
jgi:hypothetical protein